MITGDIDALGGTDANTSGGNAGGAVTLNAGTTLSVGAIDSSGSNSVGGANTGGNAGVIDLDGASGVTLNDDLTAVGGTGTNGTQGNGGSVIFDDTVTLNKTGGTVTIDSRGNTGGGVTFAALNATSAFDENLTVRGGAITFGGTVGATALGNVIISDSTAVISMRRLPQNP